MNTKPLFAIALVALLGANAASAQERVPATWNDSYTPNVAVQIGGKTRAEVKAELATARANGELNTSADNYGPLPSTSVSTKTRAQVVAELSAARANGELQASADNNYGPVDHFVSTRSRAEVRAEALQPKGATHLSQGDRTGG